MNRYKQLLFVLIITQLSVHAQTVIDATNFTPLDHERFRLVYSKYSDVSSIATGTNVYWDFTTLVNYGKDSVMYETPNTITMQANNCGFYPCLNSTADGTLAIVSPYNNGTKIYNYGTYGIVNMGGCETHTFYCKGYTLMRFPLSYNDSLVQSFGGSSEYFDQIQYTSSDSNYYTLKVIGSGTLALPNNTYNNALLVRTTLFNVHYDYMFCPTGCGYGTDTSYFWLTPNVHHRVLTINPTYSPNYKNVIYVLNSVVSLPDLSTDLKFSFAPNPMNLKAEIKFDQLISKGDFQVYNNIGQLIKQLKINNTDHIEFNRSDLPAGLYFANVTSNEGVFKSIKIAIEN